MVMKMNQEEYKKMVKKFAPQENRLNNFLIAFFVGGLVGLGGQIFVSILQVSFGMDATKSSCWLALCLIFFGSLFTAMGFFDNWVTKCKCGLIIPTTGFAHSVASSAIDYKTDGLITGLGSNFFKLAGSVILYGIIFSFLMVIVRLCIGG
jgi:stage V sporulation protein AC